MEYERMARQLPKLVHLRPPNGVSDIEFHRFSPYHSRPSEFGIELKPSWQYSYIYPFPEETLARIAYIFQSKRAPGHGAYTQSLVRVVAQWRQSFDAMNCALTWRDQEGGILVQDRRPGFMACDYIIRGHAANVYRLLDEPRPLRAAARDLVKIASNAPEPVPAKKTRRPLGAAMYSTAAYA